MATLIINCRVLEYCRSLSTSSWTANILFRMRFSFFSCSSWYSPKSSVTSERQLGRETVLVNSTPTLLRRFALLRGIRLDNTGATPSPASLGSCLDGFVSCPDRGSDGPAAAEGWVDMTGVGKIGGQNANGASDAPRFLRIFLICQLLAISAERFMRAVREHI